MSGSLMAALFVTAALGLGACGEATVAGDGQADAPVDGGRMAMCAPEAPDCVDVIVDDTPESPEDEEQAREEAQALLGVSEDEMPADTRIGRRGDEDMMLTEDYVIGRKTVELDADADGVFRVTSVTVELSGGPETFTES